jgi:dolichol-phosphate mannosyltransferase
MLDEETIAPVFCERVAAALDGIPFELIVVDDGSADGTPDAVKAAADADPRIKLLRLSRRFGHQAALTAGLDHAVGDAVVTIDGDLQDPPEVIPQLVERWRAGADVVYAIREQREGETRFKLATARAFYRLFARLTDVDLPLESGDFRLMGRNALSALLAMPERSRFLRGMTVWVGFTQTTVEYHRAARLAGETKYPLARMVRLAFDGITAFSRAPLQLAMFAGFLCSGLALLTIPLVVVARFTHAFVPGVSSTIVAILLLGGIQLITLGIMGEYLARVYDEVKGRPLYVVRERTNLERRTGAAWDRRQG